MSERYTRLFSLQENLYQVDSPVIIRAGALLKDNINGNVLAQLKFENITSKAIKALTVSVKPLDIKKDPLGESVTFQYLDLNQGRGTQFGAKVPVTLPNSGTRYFEAGVTEVVFEDLSVWHGSVDSWEPLEEPVKLSGEWDSELQKQFLLDFNHQAVYECRAVMDLWYCTCGAINHRQEEKCCSCGLMPDFMKNLDMNELKLHRDKRLEQERIAAEKEKMQQEEQRRQEEERRAAEKAEEERQHKKKVTIAVAAAVCVVAFILFMNFGVPAIKYHSAEKLAEAGSYDEAKAAFEALGDYSNSEEMVLEMRYQMACNLIDAGQYKKAEDAFEELNDYRNSQDMVVEVQYQVACVSMDAGFYKQAVEALEKLTEYKDVQDKIDEAKYGYILANKDYKDYTTREYLYDLKSKGYKDSEQIYKDLTKWKVEFYAMGEAPNGDNDKDYVRCGYYWFFFFKIVNGPSDVKTKLTAKTLFPDGITNTCKMEDEFSVGDTSALKVSYAGKHQNGEVKVELYDAQGRCVGEGSIEVRES